MDSKCNHPMHSYNCKFWVNLLTLSRAIHSFSQLTLHFHLLGAAMIGTRRLILISFVLNVLQVTINCENIADTDTGMPGFYKCAG